MDNPKKRIIILGCLVECPFYGGNPVDCQFHVARMMPIEQRLELLQKMSTQEVDDCFDKHKHHLFDLENTPHTDTTQICCNIPPTIAKQP